jgi:hypothetical protein
MTTTLIAIVFLLVVILIQLAFMLWAMTNIRQDQLMIRTWIARQLRERRVLMGAPEDDEAFYEWLRKQGARERDG